MNPVQLVFDDRLRLGVRIMYTDTLLDLSGICSQNATQLKYLLVDTPKIQNGSDHAVVASYSGLYEEYSVSISTCLA